MLFEWNYLFFPEILEENERIIEEEKPNIELPLREKIIEEEYDSGSNTYELEDCYRVDLTGHGHASLVVSQSVDWYIT